MYWILTNMPPPHPPTPSGFYLLQTETCFTYTFIWFVINYLHCVLLLFSGLPPNVNSMQVPPNPPRGMSSAQVHNKLASVFVKLK